MAQGWAAVSWGIRAARAAGGAIEEDQANVLRAAFYAGAIAHSKALNTIASLAEPQQEELRRRLAEELEIFRTQTLPELVAKVGMK